jgi:chromosome segregation ATPase
MFNTEMTRWTEKCKQNEENLSNEREKSLGLQQKIEQQNTEIDVLNRKQGDYDVELKIMKAKSLEMDEALKDRETEINTYIKKAHADEKEKYLMDREANGKTQQELEKMEVHIMQIEEEHKIEKQNLSQEIQSMIKDRKANQDEIKSLRKRVTELQAGNEALKSNYTKSLDESEAQQKELKKLQEKYRNSMSNEQALIAAKDHFEAELKGLRENATIITEEKKAWNKERVDLQAQILEMSKKLDQLNKGPGELINKYRKKAKTYKEKVRQANAKLKQLASRLTILQPEIAGEQSDPNMGRFEQDIKETLGQHQEIAKKMGI